LLAKIAHSTSRVAAARRIGKHQAGSLSRPTNSTTALARLQNAILIIPVSSISGSCGSMTDTKAIRAPASER
jgi:hypothetical protein